MENMTRNREFASLLAGMRKSRAIAHLLGQNWQYPNIGGQDPNRMEFSSGIARPISHVGLRGLYASQTGWYE